MAYLSHCPQCGASSAAHLGNSDISRNSLFFKTLAAGRWAFRCVTLAIKQSSVSFILHGADSYFDSEIVNGFVIVQGQDRHIALELADEQKLDRDQLAVCVTG